MFLKNHIFHIDKESSVVYKAGSFGQAGTFLE